MIRLFGLPPLMLFNNLNARDLGAFRTLLAVVFYLSIMSFAIAIRNFVTSHVLIVVTCPLLTGS